MKINSFKNKIIASFIISFAIILGCSSSNLKLKKDCYYVRAINSTLIEEYNLITVENKDKGILFVISNKLPDIKENDSLIAIKKGDCQMLRLYKIDTTILATPQNVRTTNGQIFIDSVLFWQNDTVKVVVYMSPNIFDKFVLKIEK